MTSKPIDIKLRLSFCPFLIIDAFLNHSSVFILWAVVRTSEKVSEELYV